MLYRTPSYLSALAPPVLLAKGCASVIQLEKFKAQAADHWPRIREGVYARLESLLKGMLGPSDFFARMDETAYLVVMPTVDPEEVSVTCLRVAFDLHTSFLGQCNVDQIEVGTARISPIADQLELIKLPAARIALLANKAGIQFGAPPTPVQPVTKTPIPQAAPPRNAVHYPTGLAQPILPGPTGFKIEHQYLPVWAVQNSAVTTYVCETKEVHVENRRDNIPLHALSPTERREVDMSCFMAGTTCLTKAVNAGKPFLLAVGLSFDVLGSPAWRKDIINALRELDQTFRQYLGFIICDVPFGVAQTRLTNMVTLLKPFGRSVSATIAPQTKNLAVYAGIGLTSIGYRLGDFVHSQKLNQHDIEVLALYARRNNLLTFLEGVKNVNMLKHAQDAGVQFLSGPAIAPPSAEPRGMWRLTWDKLISESLVELWV